MAKPKPPRVIAKVVTKVTMCNRDEYMLTEPFASFTARWAVAKQQHGILPIKPDNHKDPVMLTLNPDHISAVAAEEEYFNESESSSSTPQAPS